MKCICNDCGRRYDEEDLDPIHDLSERVSAGEIFPAGQCPNKKCGALCHVERPPVFITINGGVATDVTGLPAGIEYEVIDWDAVESDPADSWKRLSAAAQLFVKTKCKHDYEILIAPNLPEYGRKPEGKRANSR